MIARKNIYLLLFTVTIGFSSTAQMSPERLRQFIESTDGGPRRAGIKEFYSRINYRPAWLIKENHVNRTIFFEAIKQSPNVGLREKDYSGELMSSLRKNLLPLQTAQDSLVAEVAITDAAIHFYSDMAYGNIKPAIGYYGMDYVPGCIDVPALLADGISKNTLNFLPGRLSPPLPVIIALEKKIKWVNTVMADSSYKEVNITSNKLGGNQVLVTKLYQMGIISTDIQKIPDSILKQKVKEAQRQFSLLADGVLRSTIIQELNVPLEVRLQQLNLSINYYRWLYCLLQNQSAIVVNIPSAYMKVYNHGKVNLEMRMIVGKASTPTSTLLSKVTEVILYPYWHVPHSIATRELLPIIKRNPGYINAGNYQVLNKAGNIVDPYSINWHALGSNYFPYLIRQSTGCDNALGLLKLNFYSPYGIYLHDTPVKSLFMLNKRYFSHGCMRMEKPMELGHMVLKNNSIAIDTLEQKGCLRNQAPVTVPADDPMPVIVWYNPVDIDATGRIVFYEDIYNKFHLSQNN